MQIAVLLNNQFILISFMIFLQPVVRFFAEKSFFFKQKLSDVLLSCRDSFLTYSYSAMEVF